MKIIVAKNAGFCFGVKRAVDAVYENISDTGRIYTLGPIIHNPQVVNELKKKGVIIEENVENITEGTVIIRSHGVAESIMNSIKDKGLSFIDATCPYVKRIHGLVSKYFGEGYQIIIIGEKNHPEVLGINGWCQNSANIIHDESDVSLLPDMEKACVVVQTTTNEQKFNNIIDALKAKVKDLKVFNTICYATQDRQKEAEEIAKLTDKVIVIGGRNSSNTKKLYNLSKNHCSETYAIETADDISSHNINLTSGDVIGILAGASTPDWIIKEVVDKMNEINNKLEETKEVNNTNEVEAAGNVNQAVEDNNDSVVENNDNGTNDDYEITSMEDFEKTMVVLRPGQVVTGTVIEVLDDEVYVNVGYKSDGIIPMEEIMLDKGQKPSDLFKVGDSIEVTVVKVNDGDGNVLLSHKAIAKRRVWQELEKAYKEQTVLKGIGHEVVKGGIIAKVKGVSAFIPASQLSTHYVEDLSVFINQTMDLKILEMDKRRNRLVASQRVVLEEIQKQKEDKVWESLEEGQKIKGQVKRLTSFGAFIDVGGVDGLAHISDLSWHHITHPGDVLKEGDEVEVVVLSFDRDKDKISLGYKQLMPHPWDNIEIKYPEGQVFEGKVARIASFGAFVELEPGVDGLVHISQISDKRIEKVEDVLSVGDQVQVKVLKVVPDEKRISLSIKEAQKKDELKEPSAGESSDENSEFVNEDMTVVLGDFFPENLTENE